MEVLYVAHISLPCASEWRTRDYCVGVSLLFCQQHFPFLLLEVYV
jgi:hypothetical protein